VAPGWCLRRQSRQLLDAGAPIAPRREEFRQRFHPAAGKRAHGSVRVAVDREKRGIGGQGIGGEDRAVAANGHHQITAPAIRRREILHRDLPHLIPGQGQTDRGQTGPVAIRRGQQQIPGGGAGLDQPAEVVAGEALRSGGLGDDEDGGHAMRMADRPAEATALAWNRYRRTLPRHLRGTMAFNCGIVGLPNVGKSTIFNALTQTQVAEAANYPFCTIEPNTGKVNVPDARLAVLQGIVRTDRVIPTQMEIVDIAGLVKGAAQGEGKGNEFLSAIKNVDAVLHVVRCFDDPDVVHVDGSVNPVRDIEIIDLELMLKDEATLRAALDKSRKRAASDKDLAARLPTYEKCLAGFAGMQPVRALGLTEDEQRHIADLHLITAKAMLFVCNIADTDIKAGGSRHSAAVTAHAATVGARSIIISGKIEAELVALAADERAAFMSDLGIAEPGVDTLVKAGYDLLGLATYFTAGEVEVRAWQIQRGWKAPRAAGVIHTDFEKGFIRAEVAAYADYVAHQGEKGCREAGRLRAEGKDYVVRDGDVCHFLFNR
jgi:ribosome-binding ATPase